MNNISSIFTDLFRPESLLVFYKNGNRQNVRYYVESFQLDSDGRPLAPHPLSDEEAHAIARILEEPDGQGSKRHFLQAEGIFPKELLHIGYSPEPFVVWFSPSAVVPLLFQPALKIPSGPAAIPPLIWKATAKTISVYAVTEGRRPILSTRLYHAPFFNLYENGEVCMGTVRVTVPPDCSLEKFMALWQGYFFGSYFAHLLIDESPVRGNVVELWQELVGTHKPFPEEVLKPSSVTIKELIA